MLLRPMAVSFLLLAANKMEQRFFHFRWVLIFLKDAEDTLDTSRSTPGLLQLTFFIWLLFRMRATKNFETILMIPVENQPFLFLPPKASKKLSLWQKRSKKMFEFFLPPKSNLVEDLGWLPLDRLRIAGLDPVLPHLVGVRDQMVLECVEQLLKLYSFRNVFSMKKFLIYWRIFKKNTFKCLFKASVTW